ncbi:hypothetical protein [Methylobacterium brachiatum]|uniref:hypothetical protein n=1 Tax=Methylobacterium brachiatum TaxID=269660 RepID=UPI00244C6E2B|nr:hypothetical protein [Methylobacterium brachiatum]MDH2313989.1 hypothetical protein [Methylobacterium brachiatum]
MHVPVTPQLPLLARALADLSDAGVHVSPLAVVSRLTDLGASDAEVRHALAELETAGSTKAAA